MKERMQNKFPKILLLALLGFISASAQAAHPLVTEDAGVQGKGKQQIEINTDRVSEERSSYGSALAYTYGVTDKFDLFAAIPSTWSPTPGINDASLGGKYLFSDASGTAWALKAEFVFPTGNVDKGLGNDSHALSMTLVRSMELGSWSIHNNLALTWHRYRDSADQINRRELIWATSVAAQYALNAQWQVVADLGVTQADEEQDRSHPVFAVLGLVYSPNDSIDLDIGVTQLRIQGNNERQIGIGLTWHF